MLLISGGGSALFEAPLIPQADSARLTEQLLASGAGIVEILAGEINAEIDAQKHALLSAGKAGSRVEIRAKGLSFGFLSLDARGALDTHEIVGIDADLRLKPFGWKGNMATIRDASGIPSPV